MTQDDHKHLHELISAMADGILTPEEAAQAQIHLKDCADCRQLLHDIRRIATAVGEEGVPPVPGYLAGRIRERLITGGAFESRSLSPAIPFWKSPFPLAAAATLLLVSVIWLAWPGGSHVSPPPPAPGEPQTELRRDTMGERDSAKPEAPPPVARPSESVPMAPKTAQEKAQAPVPELEGHSGSLQPRVPSRLAAGDEGSRRNEAPAPSKEEAYLDRVTSSGLTGEDYKKAKGRERQDAPVAKDENALAPAASSAGSVSTVGEIRSLVYEGPDYSATFVEDGLITIVARGYACSADVPVSKPGASSGERSKSVEDLLSLFAVAGSREFVGAAATAEDQASTATSSFVLRNGQGDPIHSISFSDPLPEDAPKTLRGLRQGVGHLVKDRYRSEIETRCGPLPKPILDSP